jgi:hypothetical protein
LVVVKVNIFIDQELSLLEGWFLELAEIFFFEMPEEIFHRGIVPAITTSRHGGGDVILLRKDILIRL